MIPGLRVGEERQFNLADDTYTKVDVLVWPSQMEGYDVRGPDALLVVEIAHTSLRKDTGFKQRLYASFGVREYWVIDAGDLCTRIHREPGEVGYARTAEVTASELLAPLLAPGLALRLRDLEID